MASAASSGHGRNIRRRSPSSRWRNGSGAHYDRFERVRFQPYHKLRSESPALAAEVSPWDSAAKADFILKVTARLKPRPLKANRTFQTRSGVSRTYLVLHSMHAP